MDEIVNQLELLPVVAECYQKWWSLQCQAEDYCAERERTRPPLSPEQDYGVNTAFWDLKMMVQDESLPVDERDAAIERLEKLAQHGDVDAQYLMGTLYRDGPLVVPDDEKAQEWYERAANRGMVAAQHALGKLLQEQGHIDEAVGWYKKAADQGNQFAKYQLGKLYLTEQGAHQDMELARYWFTQSANQGNEYAQFFLAHMDQAQRPSVLLAATNLLYHLSRIFREQAPQDSTAGGIQIDRKPMARIREKKIAMGHKPDDHEDPVQEQGWGMSMI